MSKPSPSPVTRRGLLIGSTALPVAHVAGALAQAAPTAAPMAAPAAPIALPDRLNFPQGDTVNFDSGTSHQIGVAARNAVDAYVARRAGDRTVPPQPREREDISSKFARLINARRDEIALVQSTTTGEQMVLRAIGLPRKGAHIVVDTLHFFGSFAMYEELARQGCEVTWVRHRPDGTIATEDMARAIRPGTVLVALSLVSTFNGFQHDLKKICEMAHTVGAVVYADIIHAAGCVPVDVRATGVDFAACSSYKWLMGDFGLGFLFARKDRQAALERVFYGYHGVTRFASHVYPFDTPGERVADYAYEDSANGRFALGTYSHTGEALLSKSLDYLLAVGPDRIQAHARPLVGKLRRELPRLGFQLFTPIDAPTPFVTCILEDARGKIGARLAEAKVRVTLSRNRFRVTTSVFNDQDDVDRLLKALA